ncbi:hypothetical protein, partial [Paraburkholderia caffeinilytica]|uniref:hypothetical protein n=1 Tax=Paraburkholderia caffeinilytica TaxID=1761016 RepID=UPI001C2E7D9C
MDIEMAGHLRDIYDPLFRRAVFLPGCFCRTMCLPHCFCRVNAETPPFRGGVSAAAGEPDDYLLSHGNPHYHR